MVSNSANISTPTGSRNNGANGNIALAPAVVQCRGNLISGDFIGTFPDYYLENESSTAAQASVNPKYNFGPVTLVATNGTQRATIGAVDYANTVQGDQQGWLFDFDITANQEAQRVLRDQNPTFKLVHAALGDALAETDYYFVTNQQAIYAEQFGSG